MEIDEDFRCSACHYVLIEPKFTACAHRYCQNCLKKLLMSNQSAICLVNSCRQPINKNEIFPDFPIEKLLKRLTTIVCANKSNGCEWKGDYPMYKEHLDKCSFGRFQCELCSAEFSQRSIYEEHFSACPKAFVLCPLNSVGCKVEIRREALPDHLTSSMVEHFQRLAEKLTTNSNENVENDKFRTTLNKIQQELVRMRIDSQLSTGKFCQMVKNFDLTQSLIDNDGTFVWCIENVQQSFLNAKNSVEPVCLISSPFYTSKSGYKLSLKVYLNGDKNVRNSHLSLYVTLMRNDFDTLLQWPFPYPITFCLYDQSSRRDHVVHTLKPDEQSESFQQPRMETNKSSGIRDFCPLWKLFSKEFGYVKGNRMFIKTFVDFHLFPTSIWPLWTKLQSAGLPTSVEQLMLKNLTEDK